MINQFVIFLQPDFILVPGSFIPAFRRCAPHLKRFTDNRKLTLFPIIVNNCAFFKLFLKNTDRF